MKVEANGVYFNCCVEGLSGAPWLILSNSLSSNLSMWEPQIPVLSERFRILRYDQRGHGSSTATEGDYSFELLSEDVIALMNALNIGQCHFIGLSMGGMTAIPLAIKHSDRLKSIIISNSRADMNKDFRRSFDERIDLALSEGMEPLVESTIGRWFTKSSIKRRLPVIDKAREMIRTTPVIGYAGCARAVQKIDYLSKLPEIITPVLLISGSEDIATPPDAMRLMHNAITNSQYHEISAAGHLSNLEQPQMFNTEVLKFLQI